MINENIIKEIQKSVKALQKKSKAKFDVPGVDIEHPKDTAHGDYSTNIAMKLSGVVGKKPMEIAENIKKQLTLLRIATDGHAVNSKQITGIEKIEVAAPGFINFYLSSEYLLDQVKKINKEKDRFGSQNIGKSKAIVIDYSHPNIAKPIGVHHLPTTLIGDSIKRSYKFLGYKTIADNFLGDWGTQFGKVIYAYKNWGKKGEIEKDPIPELLKLYVKFHQKSDKDESLDDKAREEFKKLEDGDKENRRLWKWMREESIKELKEMYKLLGIEFDYYNGEAFYESYLSGTLDDLKKKKLLKDGEGGAKIVDLESENFGNALVQKSDGATLYLTRDIAAIKYRVDKYKPERVVYVVENAQSLHLSQLFSIAKKANYLKKTGAVHVKFGTMKLPEGGMSTRKGKVVFLWKVLEEAQKKALKIIEKKNPKLKDKEKVAGMVGVGAVKYAILSTNRLSDISFTWDRILSLDGDSAPYIMYSYARSRAILRKFQKTKNKKQITKLPITNYQIEKEEDGLLRKLYIFPEIVEKAAGEYQPNVISNYVYELSQTFNVFYNKVPVLNADKEIRTLRLNIVSATAQVIENGMALLGIDLPEEM